MSRVVASRALLGLQLNSNMFQPDAGVSAEHGVLQKRQQA
jgi:hypothetical protein